MNDPDRARRALSRLPPHVLSELEAAVQAFIQTELDDATPAALWAAANAIERNSRSMPDTEAAVAQMFAAVLRRRVGR